MTVSYQYDVASSASGGFIRLLFRWRGSVWKVVYREMLIFSICYIALSVLYNFMLTESQQSIFEQVVFFCSTFMDLIPLSFMLGFYVSFIAARWWSQFIAIPWPDKLMNIVAMYIPGFDESSRVVRRTLMRYLNLSLVLVLRSISMAVKRRFPTKEHLIEAGFMTKTELEMFQSVPSTEFNTFWIPCTWFINVLREARQECRITDSNGLKLIMEELNEFRSKCGLLWGYDWISIPLVYTQVVTMATYAFYVACMFGRQNVNIVNDKPASPEVHRYDFYVPIFTILQLMFYMGLLKVAEQLINPFGDDDEDFELNWIIDRHMKVSYLGVDTLNGTPPPLVKDTYYNELDVKIPYTEASKSYKKKTYRGSVAYMQVPMEQQHMVVPDMSEEEDDGETMTDSMGVRRPSMYSLFQASRGISPAGSSANLKSLYDSDLDLAAKNASGTSLGSPQAAFVVVDMAVAEDDEIVLQEVIVEQQPQQRPTVGRSNSLQIPGGKAHASPKIAPKFPREKLKSMFRKRKLTAALPFLHRGVHFKEGREEDSESESLLAEEEAEVDMTLSTPELTEAERETGGVHPYYFTQQTMSARQLVTGRACAVRQGARAGSEEEDKASKGVPEGVARCSSLPNISQAASPVVASALRKISKAEKKAKTPPKKEGEESPRRNTLPQITFTRYDRRGSEQQATTSSHSSSSQSSDSNLSKPPAKPLPIPPTKTVPTRHVSPPKESPHSRPRKPSPQSSGSSPEDPGRRRDSAPSKLKTKTAPPLKTKTETPLKTKTETPLKTKTETPLKTKTETPPKTKTETPFKTKTETPLKTKTVTPPKTTGQRPKEEPPVQQHSKPLPPRTSDAPRPPPEPSSVKHSKKPELPVVKFAKGEEKEGDESTRKTPRKRSPPPFRRSSLSPGRPQSLLFYSKRGSVSSKKIAGIALAPTIVPSPDSPPSSSPVIPSPDGEKAPSFPCPETVVTIFGSQEDLDRPVEAPQRRKGRSKDKK